MFRKTLIISSLVLPLVASVATAGHPDPLCWWKFDGNVLDSSGNEWHGEIIGDPAPVFVPGMFDQALDTTENNGPGYVQVPGFKGILGGNPFSITAWINTSDDTGTLVGWGSTAGGVTRFEFRPWENRLRAESSGNVQGDTTLPNDEWIHVAVTVTANAVINDPDVLLYLNGQVDNRVSTGSNTALQMASGDNVAIARRHTSGRWFDALIDDLRIYDIELTQKQVQEAMNGIGPIPPELASDVSPEHEAGDVLRDSMLVWEAGDFAQAHDVYFGTVFEDVNNASRANPGIVLANQGQTDTSYDPGRLEFGQTYYWRVDEVNGTPDRTVFKGDVWIFQTEPYSIQVAADAMTVTASSTDVQSDPNLIIDGSGLDDDGLHSDSSTDMWTSALGDMSPWLLFEMDEMQKLDKMLIWNSNHKSEAMVGWGIKDVDIQVSVDANDWTSIPDVGLVTRSSGSGPIAAHVVDMTLVQAKFVKINILSNWGGILPQYSVAEVQLFSIPTRPRTPLPEDGAVGTRPDITVAWRAGREVGHSTIYVDTDINAVAEDTAASVTSNTNAADLTVLDLQLGQTYYWKVAEVNTAEVPALWEGPVWEFTTSDALVVDDFESYGNESPDRPFQTWLDGMGYSADEFFPQPYGGNGTGAAIGHDIWSLGSPQYNGNIMETTTTVTNSDQSLPFYYSNSGGAASTTERTFVAPQDWTIARAKTLAINFYGQEGNTGTLFAKINNTKVTYPHDPAHLAVGAWLAWNIDLSSMNVQNVTSLQIGVEGAGASGMLLFDDIGVYPEPGEVLTSADPGTANLVAYYPFDGSAQDASGNGRHGTLVGSPLFVPGAAGQALELDGVDDYVDIDGYKGINADHSDPNNPIQQAFTISNWVNTTSDSGDTEMVTWGTQDGTATRLSWRIHQGRVRTEHNDGNLRGNTYVNDGEWHHIALVVTEGANLRPNATKFYVDGYEDTYFSGTDNTYRLTEGSDVRIGMSGPMDAAGNDARYFPGSLDEVRIYDRALSGGEIMSLAGITTPVDKRL